MKWAIVGVLLVAGCGGDGGAAQGGDTTGSSGSTGPTATSTAAETSATTGEGTDAGAPFEVQSEVVRYGSQPMVVDVVLTLSRVGTATLAHADDPGVVVEQTASDGTTIEFRVRGLAPASAHELEWTATADDDGAMASDAIAFDTHPPLPGFVQQFEVEATGEPEPLNRLIDITGFPMADAAGLAMVDPAGTTRWYWGEPNDVMGPPMVVAGAKLLPDGTVLYIRRDQIHRRDELGTDLLAIDAPEIGLPTFHHDVLELPNGNLLTLSMSFRDIDYPVKGTLHVAGDLLVELTATGDIVWSWDSFDHLDPLRVRDGFDLGGIYDPDTGEPAKDWTHGNGIVYEEETDSVLLSMRHQDWILRIDRASGDVVWRLGDEGDFALQGTDEWFFHQHSPQWQPDGSLLLYDNGVANPNPSPFGERSRAARFSIDETAMTATLEWEDDEAQFVSQIAGDADLLPGGHLLVLDSTWVVDFVQRSRLRELDPTASPQRLWTLVTEPSKFVYRATAHARLVGQAAP